MATVLRIASRDVLMSDERIARFHAKHTTGGGCHQWLGGTDPEGYGKHKVGKGNLFMAHRIAYMLANGPIESDQQLDHTCRNTSCVNPDHLEQVTPKVNTQRSIRVSGPTCRNGHERNSVNVYITPAGVRQCRVCHRAAVERHRHAA